MSATAHADRDIGVTPVPIKTKDGQQVGLYRESHALVIGISTYTAGWPSLPGVPSDVEAVKEALEAQNFHVVTVMNPNRNQLRDAYENFINQYGHNPDNRLLFYYAGHGHTLKLAYGGDMGYIVPSDAPNPHKNKTGFLNKALDMENIEVYAKRIQAKHAIFLFDSCFSGSIFALSRAVPENINYKTSKPVRQFITAGSAEETVPDESIFRRQFIAALN
ncbi:MAG: caspase family protein, partial [Nitrospinaceae bacterium]|nr:caspase family protein [Nitrospinaceae bacterium]NIT84487.1 caspase family protein [Nitrospinaceae bacterium]NIU98867.1 peptidase C14 [Nitrospinaceae bacterium]